MENRPEDFSEWMTEEILDAEIDDFINDAYNCRLEMMS